MGVGALVAGAGKGDFSHTPARPLVQARARPPARSFTLDSRPPVTHAW